MTENQYLNIWRKANPDKLDMQKIRHAARRAAAHPEYGCIIITPADYEGKTDKELQQILSKVKNQIMKGGAN